MNGKMAAGTSGKDMSLPDRAKILLGQMILPSNKAPFFNLDRIVENGVGNSKKQPNMRSSFSFQGFVSRLRSFNPSIWGTDPYAVLYLAKNGWQNTEKYSVFCNNCKETMDCSGFLQKQDVWTFVAKKTHNKLCRWACIPFPDEFVKITTYPLQTCENMLSMWKHTIKLGGDLPSLSVDAINDMGIDNKTVEYFCKILDVPVTEEGVSALVLGICGWVKGDLDKCLQCNFCDRTVGLWNFNSIEDKRTKERELKEREERERRELEEKERREREEQERKEREEEERKERLRKAREERALKMREEEERREREEIELLEREHEERRKRIMDEYDSSDEESMIDSEDPHLMREEGEIDNPFHSSLSLQSNFFVQRKLRALRLNRNRVVKRYSVHHYINKNTFPLVSAQNDFKPKTSVVKHQTFFEEFCKQTQQRDRFSDSGDNNSADSSESEYSSANDDDFEVYSEAYLERIERPPRNTNATTLTVVSQKGEASVNGIKCEISMHTDNSSDSSVHESENSFDNDGAETCSNPEIAQKVNKMTQDEDNCVMLISEEDELSNDLDLKLKSFATKNEKLNPEFQKLNESEAESVAANELHETMEIADKTDNESKKMENHVSEVDPSKYKTSDLDSCNKESDEQDSITSTGNNMCEVSQEKAQGGTDKVTTTMQSASDDKKNELSENEAHPVPIVKDKLVASKQTHDNEASIAPDLISTSGESRIKQDSLTNDENDVSLTVAKINNDLSTDAALKTKNGKSCVLETEVCNNTKVNVHDSTNVIANHIAITKNGISSKVKTQEHTSQDDSKLADESGSNLTLGKAQKTIPNKLEENNTSDGDSKLHNNITKCSVAEIKPVDTKGGITLLENCSDDVDSSETSKTNLIENKLHNNITENAEIRGNGLETVDVVRNEKSKFEEVSTSDTNNICSISEGEAVKVNENSNNAAKVVDEPMEASCETVEATISGGDSDIEVTHGKSGVTDNLEIDKPQAVFVATENPQNCAEIVGEEKHKDSSIQKSSAKTDTVSVELEGKSDNSIHDSENGEERKLGENLKDEIKNTDMNDNANTGQGIGSAVVKTTHNLSEDVKTDPVGDSANPANNLTKHIGDKTDRSCKDENTEKTIDASVKDAPANEIKNSTVDVREKPISSESDKLQESKSLELVTCQAETQDMEVTENSDDKLNQTSEDMEVTENSGDKLNQTSEDMEVTENSDDKLNQTSEDTKVTENSGEKLNQTSDVLNTAILKKNTEGKKSVDLAESVIKQTDDETVKTSQHDDVAESEVVDQSVVDSTTVETNKVADSTKNIVIQSVDSVAMETFETNKSAIAVKSESVDTLVDDSTTVGTNKSADPSESGTVDKSADSTESGTVDKSADSTESGTVDKSADSTESGTVDKSADSTESGTVDKSIGNSIAGVETIERDKSAELTENGNVDTSANMTKSVTVDKSVENSTAVVETIERDKSADSTESGTVDDSVGKSTAVETLEENKTDDLAKSGIVDKADADSTTVEDAVESNNLNNPTESAVVDQSVSDSTVEEMEVENGTVSGNKVCEGNKDVKNVDSTDLNRTSAAVGQVNEDSAACEPVIEGTDKNIWGEVSERVVVEASVTLSESRMDVDEIISENKCSKSLESGTIDQTRSGSTEEAISAVSVEVNSLHDSVECEVKDSRLMNISNEVLDLDTNKVGVSSENVLTGKTTFDSSKNSATDTDLERIKSGVGVEENCIDEPKNSGPIVESSKCVGKEERTVVKPEDDGEYVVYVPSDTDNETPSAVEESELDISDEMCSTIVVSNARSVSALESETCEDQSHIDDQENVTYSDAEGEHSDDGNRLSENEKGTSCDNLTSRESTTSKKRKVECIEDLMEVLDTKKRKGEFQEFKVDFHPVNEHRFCCVWRLEAMDKLCRPDASIAKLGWQQILDDLKEAISMIQTVHDSEEYFNEVMRLGDHLDSW